MEVRRWKERWVCGKSGCGWPVSVLTRGIRRVERVRRVVVKEGWRLRFLEGIGIVISGGLVG